MQPTVALAGNPNTGKTSLFNALTGAGQEVGNWPGQTVEIKTAQLDAAGVMCRLIDLPGVYGLVPVSAEEEAAADLLTDRPDAVATVIDASNLEQSLHLATQIAELGLPQVVACNMSDVAGRRGIAIDHRRLGEMLGATVVPTIARRGEGAADVRAAVADILATGAPGPLVVDYGPIVEQHLAVLVAAITEAPAVDALAPARWLAVQLLSGDDRMRERVAAYAGGTGVLRAAERVRQEIEADLGDNAGLALAERRYALVRRFVQDVTGGGGGAPVWSDRIDRVVTHPFLGVPVFLAVMWLVLKITADVTAPMLEWVDTIISGPISRWVAAGLDAAGLGGTWVEGLVVDGVLPGVGGVLVFVPVLFGLYATLAVLEDTGYLARAALVMERALHAFGVPGKAFLPMMVGFGCSVPAIYATRTLDTSRDRLLTGMLVPFMSCSARLPVYVLLASIFFTASSGTVVFAMYLLGIAVAMLVGVLLSRTMLRDEDPVPFVMVLPEFRLPSGRTVWTLVKRRTWAFIRSAGTLILAASVAVWVLLAIPIGGGSFGDTNVEDSAFGGIAGAASNVMEPLGFGGWEHSGALLSGFVAKEVVVSTMNQLYGGEAAGSNSTTGFTEDLGEIGGGLVDAALDTLWAVLGVVGLDFAEVHDETSAAVDERIRSSFETSSDGRGALAALSFMVFVLLYTPCMAAVGALRHEFGPRWMTVSVVGQLAIAWLGALLVFQGGRLLGVG